ncbi:MAG: putative hydrolase or acyltransferase of alpha/beta superfamily [Dehalococcoidia bacterium]|nr:putative hydrolase or acyltransferase of alpha/beta superfamily [Dehalococcoidia bacterium]
MAEHRYLTVGGVHTHYVAAGKGPPLLLLHGLGASSVAWSANIAPLSQRYSVYALDIPGHGDSDKPDIDYQVPAGARFIRAFMHVLGINRASLAGNSMGGMLALRTALEFPHLVEKLVLVDAAGLGRELGWSVRLLSLPLAGEILEDTSLRGTGAMLRRIFYDRSFVQEGLLQELHRTRRMPGAKEAVLKTVRGAVSLRGLRKEWVMVEALKSLDAPVLIVWGAQDRIVPVRHAHNAARLAPDVRLCIFDGCGHWPQMEKSSQFNQVVLEFLSGE